MSHQPPHHASLTFASRFNATVVSIRVSCVACSVVSHADSVRLLIPYSHTACARAFISTHPDDAVLSFAPIVPLVLNSEEIVFHTALASHSGESSVKGVITHVI